jgi:hypothetical protein
MSTRWQLVAGTCAGILAGLGLAHLAASRPQAVPPPLASAQHARASEPRELPLEALEAPLESADPQAARSEAVVAESTRMGVLEALLKAGAPSQETAERLPSLRRLLLDPELNPEQRRCTDEAQRLELEAYIATKNQELDQLEQQHTGLVDTVLAAKIAAGIDAPSTWSTIPREELVLACQVSVGDGAELGTVIRKGEHPEIEQLSQQIAAAREVARSELRERIARLAPR